MGAVMKGANMIKVILVIFIATLQMVERWTLVTGQG